MHCSDEQLLAHFDGELGLLANRRVKRHLESCWRCRTRLAALEEEIRHVMVASDEWHFPSPQWKHEAGRRLAAGMQDHEALLTIAPNAGFRRVAIPGAIAAAIFMAALAWWQYRPVQRADDPRPLDVVAQAARMERDAYAKPVHQTFALHIAEIGPGAKAVDEQLQVWADRDGGRFASRISGSDGSLKHALWRPAGNQEYVFQPRESHHAVEHSQHRVEEVSLASLAENGLDPAAIEASFMRWMERRAWTPIAFSSDLSLWTAADGSIAKAERVLLANRGPAVRLTVERRMRRVVAMLSVEVDSNSHLPRLQTIRFETPERAVEVRLEAITVQTMERSEIVPAVFHPDPGLEPGPIAGASAMLRNTEDPAPPKLPAEDRRPLWDAEEIRARYALHLGGACLGESVRIAEGADQVNVLRIGTAAAYPAGARLDTVLGALASLREAAPPREGSMALRHAWALRYETNDLRTKKLRGLNGGSLDRVETIVRDHLAFLRDVLAEWGAQAVESNRDFAIGDWRDATASIFDGLAKLSATPSTKDQRALVDSVLRNVQGFRRGFDNEMLRARAALIESATGR